MKKHRVSIVVPIYNEKENIPLLVNAIVQAVPDYHELILINDGSKDGSAQVLDKIAPKHKNIRVLHFRKNYGQTSAMDAGFKAATGDVIVPLDADLQNDPKDIPRLVKKLDEGYDVVCGWRAARKDPILKKVVSKMANFLRRRLIAENIHDSGCTMKAFRKECFDRIDLYGEMHRYIPAFLRTRGFRVTELKVTHHPRRHGVSKYGHKRMVKGFLDLIMIYYWTHFATRPVHVFGALGILSFIGGFGTGVWLLVEKFVYGASLADRPLVLLVMLLILLGVQLISFGVLAEVLMRIYYKVHGITPYNIKKK
jgi:glycosyltransferase involved in cell wall biosynthesis